MKVNNFFKDISGVKRIVKERKQKIKEASEIPVKLDPISSIASEIHPGLMNLKIISIKNETESTKTFRFAIEPSLKVKKLPVFMAGQYLSFKFFLKGSYATRAYSISSSPYEARKLEDPFVEVTIRKKDDGFITDYIWKNWKVGLIVKAEGGFGNFYYEPLRDKRNIVAIAGGSGITPFRSMIKELIFTEENIHITLLYGSKNFEDIIFYNEFLELEKENSEKIKVINVLSNDENWNGEKGFINSKLIEKYCDPAKVSFFICGPQVMYKFMEKELSILNVPKKQIRREVFGEVADIYCMDDFDVNAKGKEFNIKVNMGCDFVNIKAKSSETVLIALEKAGIKHDSRCRSGECGYCRSLLIKGKIYVFKENDGRRKADKLNNYFHPCSSYPLSDLEIRIPIV